MATDPPSTSSSLHQTINNSSSNNNNTRMHSPNAQRQRASAAAGASAPSSDSLASNGYRPLNVKDALTYLDQVKVKFADQPEVYNRFLDIMKEFKSQAIDTPGVIERVSTLFRGHPALIFGFNTFLPPGYHIECSTDDHARDIIRVTTPTGTTTTSTSEPILSLQGAESSTQSDQQPRYYQPYPTASGVYRSSPTASNTEPMLNMQVAETAANTSDQPPRYYQPYPTTPTSASGYRSSPTGPLPSISSYHPSIHHAPPPPPPPPPHHQQQQQQQQQHQQHHTPPNAATIPPTSSSRATMDESANAGKRSPVEFNHAINYVNKIKNRFSGDPETYKQFLEILQTYQKEQKPIQEVYAQVQVLFNGSNDLLAEFKQFLPDTTETTTTTVNEKRRNESSTVNHRHVKRSKTKNQDDISDIRASLLPITPEEQHFFERIREHSTNYAVFLKNLSLYTQQMIDGNTLVDQCESIIKEQDLVQMLKRMVGYKVQDQIIENIPQLEKPNLKKSKQHGTSYRLRPESWKEYQCSGRDALCDQVLNDTHISTPNYNNKNHVPSHKINEYEEAMHRVEDQRLEYDSFIDANLHIIALLEPVAQQLETMSEDDKTDFRLPSVFGPSKSIYQRIIRQVYGKDKGSAIVKRLHDCPAQVVPVLLSRLKERNIQWKQKQREWNRVWREIESQNYYRSLDYQGVDFKMDDRKKLPVRALAKEIEELHADDPSTPQFQFEFKDKTLLKDVTRILFSYLERRGGYRGGHKDDELIKAFIEMFLPVLFDVPDVLPTEDKELEDEEEVEEDETQSQHSYDSELSSGTRRGRSSPRHRLMNDDEKPLLKDVLTRSIKNTVAASSDEDEEEIPEEEEPKEPKEPKEQKFHRFFGNTAFYCFFRLLQIAYERLGAVKLLDQHHEKGLNVTTKTMYSVNIDFKSGYYKPMLKLIDRYFDKDVDQDEFEECARYIYGNQAYLLFTIDMVMASIINQLHIIVTKPKAQELLSLYKKNYQHETNTPELTKAYRQEVTEMLTPDDDLYNITFDTLNRTLSIQILSEDDEPFEFIQNEHHHQDTLDPTSSTLEIVEK